MQNSENQLIDFIMRFLVIFAVEVMIVSILGALQGDHAVTYSSFYSLGKSGISYITLWQLGFAAIMISLSFSLVFSGKLFTNLMLVWRTVIMLVIIIAVILFCIIVFDWFPVDYVPGWIGFFLSFGICFAVSTFVMFFKTKSESKKYEELLEKYKKTEQDKINSK